MAIIRNEGYNPHYTRLAHDGADYYFYGEIANTRRAIYTICNGIDFMVIDYDDIPQLAESAKKTSIYAAYKRMIADSGSCTSELFIRVEKSVIDSGKSHKEAKSIAMSLCVNAINKALKPIKYRLGVYANMYETVSSERYGDSGSCFYSGHSGQHARWRAIQSRIGWCFKIDYMSDNGEWLAWGRWLGADFDGKHLCYNLYTSANAKGIRPVDLNDVSVVMKQHGYKDSKGVEIYSGYIYINNNKGVIFDKEEVNGKIILNDFFIERIDIILHNPEYDDSEEISGEKNCVTYGFKDIKGWPDYKTEVIVAKNYLAKKCIKCGDVRCAKWKDVCSNCESVLHVQFNHKVSCDICGGLHSHEALYSMERNSIRVIDAVDIDKVVKYAVSIGGVMDGIGKHEHVCEDCFNKKIYEISVCKEEYEMFIENHSCTYCENPLMGYDEDYEYWTNGRKVCRHCGDNLVSRAGYRSNLFTRHIEAMMEIKNIELRRIVRNARARREREIARWSSIGEEREISVNGCGAYAIESGILISQYYIPATDEVEDRITQITQEVIA